MNPKIFCLLSFFVFVAPTAAFGNLHKNYDIPVKSIQFKGLRNLSLERIYPHLPISVGQPINPKNTDLIIKRLYGTGFFDTIKVFEESGRITIEVIERPVIKQITLKAQRLNDKLVEQFLVARNIKVGEFLSSPALRAFEKDLQSYERNSSQYQNEIHTKIIPDKNKDQVHLEIDLPPQKEALKFSEIYIKGNHAFSEKELLSVLPVSNNPLKALLTQKILLCHPSTQQIALEALKHFYQNKGYLEVDLKTKHTSITPDHKAAYWIIAVKEGPLYKIGEHKIICPPKLNTPALRACIDFKANQPYSKEVIVQTEQALKDKLDNVSAQVEIVPSINQKKSTVDFTIKIAIQKPTYVRKLHIMGNHYIQDQAIRRLCQQQEAALYSAHDIKISEMRLNRSGFSKTPVSIYKMPIKGSDDRIDLMLKIDEDPGEVKINPGIFSFGLDTFAASVTASMANILGTGTMGDIQLSKSKQDYILSVLHHHPYHTLDGIQRTFRVNFLSRHPLVFLKEQFPDPTRKLFQEISEAWSQHVIQPTSEAWSQHVVQPIATSWPWGSISSLWQGTNEKTLIKPEDNPQETTEATEPVQKTEISKYDINELSAMLKYGIPINEKGHLWTFKIEPKIFQLRLPEEEKLQSAELTNFLDQHKNNFWQIPFTTGFNINQVVGSRYFPDKGFYSQVNITQSFLWTHEWYFYPYFKLDLQGFNYHQFKFSINQEMNLGIRWKIGYGFGWRAQTPELPFFENYHSGQIRGFGSNSLGPKDNLQKQLGANFMFNGSMIWCAPKPLRGDNIRLSAFCDIGALNNITKLQMLFDQITPKIAVGLSVDTVISIPMMGTMPLNLSIAKPIWYQEKDKKQLISIAINSSLV